MSDALYSFIGPQIPSDIVVVCDHASNRAPEGVELGVSEEVMQKHIAWDIGTAEVVEQLAEKSHFPAMLARVSRLVVDLHREEESFGLIPEVSDGIAIPGNLGANREGRLNAFHRPYHKAMGEWLDMLAPKLILSIHSFTPAMENAPKHRPWEIGLLYNQDDRAARLALNYFDNRGVITGENEPYTGKQFNATMNRHAEAYGRPYCAIEIRNDLITDKAGQSHYAALISEMAREIVKVL